jgi:hypothetical protein
MKRLKNTAKDIESYRDVAGYRSETDNKTTSVARQQILNNATVGLQQRKSCVFYETKRRLGVWCGMAAS